MKSHSTMKPKDVMTFLFVVTLFTNLARHDLGTVSALSNAEKRNLSSKRRFLQRMIRLKLSSSTEQNKINPTTTIGNSYRVNRNSSNDLFEWFLSNHLPDSDSVKAMDASDHFDLTNRLNASLSSSLKQERYIPHEDDQPWHRYREEHLLRQMEQTGMEENTQVRRHVNLLPLEGNTRRKRKKEGKLRREEKRKKRNKEKKKRRKDNKRLQDLIDNDNLVLHNIDGEDFFDCCPSKLVVVEKQVGKDRNNHAVEVRPSHQYFYERVCLPDIEESGCVFPSRALRRGTKTRCTQQFSYVQAQVRPYLSQVDWHLDYIHVRSGCSCQVSATPVKRRKKKETLPDE